MGSRHGDITNPMFVFCYDFEVAWIFHQQPYVKKICHNGILDSKSVWNKLKPYLFGKIHDDSDICLTENDNLISDQKTVADIMNRYFISVGRTTVKTNMGEYSSLSLGQIINVLEKHSGIISIKNNLKHQSLFDFNLLPKIH